MPVPQRPVLAVAPGARDVDDPLQLWSVFSRCKDSLQDGRRLENISWRLAFRELNSRRHLDSSPSGPPTPESLDSEATPESFFHARSEVGTHAGRIICDMVPPGLTQLQKGYPTPASSSSSSAASAAASASSSAVSIAAEEPQQPRVEQPQQEEAATLVPEATLVPGAPIFHMVVNTPTPNLTPHPTPPTTPLLSASPSPVRNSSPATTLEPPRPAPLFLPRSATRGMGSPTGPQSTHSLPLGGRSAFAPSSSRGMFFLNPSHSSWRSSQSNSTSGGSDESSESSREREAQEARKQYVDRGVSCVAARRALPRGRAGSSARLEGPAPAPSQSHLQEQEQKQVPQPQPQLQPPPPPPPPAPAPDEPVQAVALATPTSDSNLTRLPKSVRAEVVPSPGVNTNHRKAPTEDGSVSSLATSSSNVRVRVRPKRRTEGQSRSRSRKGGTAPRRSTRSRDRRGGNHRDVAPNALGLPSELEAAQALVERTVSMHNLRKTVEVATDDDDEEEDATGTEGDTEEGDDAEEDEDAWSDEEDGEKEEGMSSRAVEPAESASGGDEEWEDEDEDEEGSAASKAKAPPPSLQQNGSAPRGHGHARGYSTDNINNPATALRQLPTRPLHRSAGHLPSLAGGKHTTHTTSAQNARTPRALKATMSATTLSSAMLEAQRQRELFAKAPRVSYENLVAAAGTRPGGLSLLLRPQQVQQQEQEQQRAYQQQQQQIGQLPPQRVRPAGGFGGLGLTMSSARPPVAGHGGVELSPIPPTPATPAAMQRTSAARQQLPPPPQPQPQATPPRRPGMARALSSSALPGQSGSLGKSSVAGPVVTPVVGSGGSGSTGTHMQNGSTSAGARSGYRPKGPPAEMEYDDEEEDESDADGRGGKGKGRAQGEGLQLSKSVAQEKLRVLAERSAILSRAKNEGSAEAERRRLYEEAGVAPWATQNGNPAPDEYAPPPPLTRAMTTAPVGFPYNLPAPAPPSTPRTTRQQMLRNEMSESVRHNLIWQRKLSRTDFHGPQPRRTKSTVNVPSAAGDEGPGRAAEKSLVRVTLRAPGAERPPMPMDPPALEGAPKKKLVRNLSWADTSDYHRTGW